MTEIRIRRLRKRYRVEHGLHAATSRLDQLLRDVVDNDLLEAALERGGIRRTDEICIRRVSANARLNDGDSNARLSTAWSVSIADAIVEALRDGGSNVVVYRSLHHAVCEMALCALRGDFSHTWAWKQVGIWKGDDVAKPETAAREIISALIRTPIAAPSVLREVAGNGLLPKLLINASPELWHRLADQALSIRGAIRSHQEESDAFDISVAEIDIESVVAYSSIVRALRGLIGDPAIAIAVAKLALLDADAGVVFRSSAALARAATLIAAELSRASASSERDHESADQVNTPAHNAITPRSRGENDGAENLPAKTEWGGLLFFLNLLRDCDFRSLLLEMPGRSLPWLLRELGMLLLPIAPNDAALLAFAGLAPSRTLAIDDRAVDEAEAAVLDNLRRSILQKLRSALNENNETSDSDLVARIAARRAEIVADPAWIEVHFKLSEVTTEVRRAGLDLDPGWLPWTGVVVRFVYG